MCFLYIETLVVWAIHSKVMCSPITVNWLLLCKWLFMYSKADAVPWSCHLQSASSPHPFLTTDLGVLPWEVLVMMAFCLMSLPTKYLLETKLKLTKTQTQHIFRWNGKSRQPPGTWVSILSSPSSTIPEHLQSCVALWQAHLLTIPGQEDQSLAHLYPLRSTWMKCVSKMSL